jgi:hypothetical protein
MIMNDELKRCRASRCNSSGEPILGTAHLTIPFLYFSFLSKLKLISADLLLVL